MEQNKPPYRYIKISIYIYRQIYKNETKTGDKGKSNKNYSRNKNLISSQIRKL